jgi:hypothetical protein
MTRLVHQAPPQERQLLLMHNVIGHGDGGGEGQ